MSDASSHASPHLIPASPEKPSCACPPKPKISPKGIAKFGAFVISLCAICCAVPAGLIAVGFVGVATGAALGFGLQITAAALAVLALGYLLVKYLRRTR